MNGRPIRQLGALMLAALVVAVTFGAQDADARIKKQKRPVLWKNPSWSISSTPELLRPDTAVRNVQTASPETLEFDLDDLIINPVFDVTSGDTLALPFGMLTLVSDSLGGCNSTDSLTFKIFGINGGGPALSGGVITQKAAMTGFLVDSLVLYPLEGSIEAPGFAGNSNGSATFAIPYGGGTQATSGARTRITRNGLPYSQAGYGGSGYWSVGNMWRRLLLADRCRIIISAGAPSARQVRAFWTYFRDE